VATFPTWGTTASRQVTCAPFCAGALQRDLQKWTLSGSDGIAYRSRWTVRRARSKADGKMQNSEVSLIRILDGQTLGDHRKTETLRLIETCIGLSFEQFTRAVLLAQNDFSTFLKATDDDRAELLQTLTGTENFSAISIQAFDRMKAEKEILLRLQVQLKDQEPLAPEIRVEKDAQFQTQSASAQVLTEPKTGAGEPIAVVPAMGAAQGNGGRGRSKLGSGHCGKTIRFAAVPAIGAG
jgi:PHD/YefM family antitoxin component YafN of YafNO toxin-antitoxin module